MYKLDYISDADEHSIICVILCPTFLTTAILMFNKAIKINYTLTTLTQHSNILYESHYHIINW